MLRSILALSIFVLPFAAQAGFTDLACQGQGISVNVTVAGSAPMQTATTQLIIDGNEIPALRACVAAAPGNQGNHRLGTSWRCPHQANGVRYEVYPLYPRPTPPNEKAPYVGVVRWVGDKAVRVDLTDCR